MIDMNFRTFSTMFFSALLIALSFHTADAQQILDEFQDSDMQTLQTKQSSVIQSTNGQVPGGFSFEAVARDANGDLIALQEVGIRVRVIQGSDNGTSVYSETHQLTTNSMGLLNLVIGEGDSDEDFNSIDWSSDNFYVALAIDPDGGTNYEDLGTTRLLSVPYAMVAKNVIEGLSADELAITQYNLNTTEGDTSFIINSAGNQGLTTFRVNSASDESNTAISGNSISESFNSAQQRGVQGIASGDGTGRHYGVFGSAVNLDAQGENRYGVYGQAASKARNNFGVLGVAQGDGDGTTVLIGEEGDQGAGSFNIAGGFYAQGNSNGNLGVEGVVTGSAGQRINIGVEGRVTANANAPNFALNGRAFNSPVENIGLSAHAEGPEGSFNIGVRGTAKGAGDNLAGQFNGMVQVNGDINYTGELNQTSDRNLKENIRPLENSLGSILKLNPTMYNFRGNGEVNGLPLTTRSHFGLIAQEVEEIFPGLVKVNRHRYKEEVEVQAGPDTPETELVEKIMEYKTLNYTELIPVLIKGMQEQQEEIELLRKEIEELKKR